ncbi:MAG: hypothetical protein JWQ71_3422 [Pedosphaera sp.]|nr:hypothetical protein [Pedosphaera sp.]
MLALFNVGGGEIILILFLSILLPLTLLAFAFWIWMLIDSIKNERLKDGEKVAWVLVIALTHLLGAVIYFFAGRSRKV